MSETAYKAMSYAIVVNEANAKCSELWLAQRRGLVALCLAPFRPCGQYKLDRDVLVKGIPCASGVGNVVANRACVAGAVGGCQAEIGTAACMAAAAIVEMGMRGTARQVRACRVIVYEKFTRPCV